MKTTSAPNAFKIFFRSGVTFAGTHNRTWYPRAPRSYSYAAPVAYPSYAASCNCGYAGYGYAAAPAPMYVVNQGPAYT